MNKRGIMFGEFFLIVIGVLVALMLETALEDRNNGALRDEYYARLLAELEIDKQAADYRIEFFRDVERFSQNTLAWLATDRPVDQKVLLESFYAAEIFPFEPNRSTYEDLLSTGNIRLVDDIDFRTQLAAYYNRADTARAGWNPPKDYRARIRGVIPAPIQAQIRQNCPTTGAHDLVPTGFPPCDLRDIDYNELTALFAPLKTDTALREMLTYRSSELAVVQYLLGQQSVRASAILTLINQQR